MQSPKIISKKSRNKHLSKLTTFIGITILFILSVFIGTNIKTLSQNISAKPVLSRLQEAEKIDDKCKLSGDLDHCYGNAFSQIAKKKGSDHAIKVLSSLQQVNPQNASGCHFIAHKISQAEVEKNPDKWMEIIGRVSPSNCTGGYLHGVLEAHMATDPSLTINEEAFKTVCDEVYATHKTWFAWRGCVHNMGHLMLVEQEGDIQTAVTSCNKISNEGMRFECLSGAFMERVTGENLVAHGLLNRTPSWDEPLAKSTEELCDKYSGMQARTCWKVISYVYFATSNHDPIGLHNKCQRAPTEQMQAECFIYGAGNMVVTTRFKPENLRTVCHQFPSGNQLFAPCMSQIIGSLLTSTTDNLDKTQELCSKTYESYRKSCFQKMISILAQNKVPINVIKNACSLVPNDMKPDSCTLI